MFAHSVQQNEVVILITELFRNIFDDAESFQLDGLMTDIRCRDRREAEVDDGTGPVIDVNTSVVTKTSAFRSAMRKHIQH